MTDDDFEGRAADERIRALVDSHYNPPAGTVPRDEIWRAVRAARRAPAGDTLPLRPSPVTPRWEWAALLAAGLLLGVAVDRVVLDRDVAPRASRSAVTQPADSLPEGDRRVAASAPSTEAPDDLQPVAGATRASRARTSATSERSGANRVVGTGRAARPRSVAAAPDAPASGRLAAGAGPGAVDVPRTLYQAVAVQTFVQAEALLTAYRRADASRPDAEAMRQTVRWSREVLSSTRLLLDSPAGRDPQLRQLLTDLELVLAQIVQLAGVPLRAGERELIERAMHDRDLIPRLRSVVPAGVTTS